MTATQKHQERYSFVRDRIDCGWFHVAAILDDGSCIAHGNNEMGQCEISQWRDVVKIKCGPFRTVGLKKDGSVLSTKGDVFTDGRIPGEEIEAFSDVTDIACGLFHTVGLRYDGTVVACGFNDEGQCNVEGWKNVKSIYAARTHTIGLCYDGSLLYCGGNDAGALHLDGLTGVKTLYCGPNDTVVITEDHRVYRTDYESVTPVLLDIDGEEVAHVAFSKDYYLILKSDGTAVALGECKGEHPNVDDWRDLLDVSCGPNGALGLSAELMWTNQTGDHHTIASKGSAIQMFGENVGFLVKVNGYVRETGTDCDEVWRLFECIPSRNEDQQEVMEPAKAVHVNRGTHRQGLAWEYLRKYGHLRDRMAGGIAHTAVILYHDQLRICGANGVGQCNLDMHTGMKSVVCTGTATVGLQNDGKVVCSGRIPVEGCTEGTPLSRWPSTIVTLAASVGGDDHVLGLSSDGRVFAFGGNMYGQCNVGAWRDITEIAAYHGLSVGVRKDGTVVTCGDDGDIRDIVSKWNGIEHVYTGLMKHHLVGLKYDGTVVATSRDYGEVSEWRDVIDIACDYDIIAGLRGNGTVSFAGDLPSEYKREGKSNVRAVNVKSGIVTTILSDGKTIVDHVYTGEETETTELDIQFVMGRNGVFHVIYVLTDGSVFVAPLKETPAPLDQTDGWLMLASLDSPTAPPAQQNETRKAEELPKPTKQPAPPLELTPTPSSAGEQNREEARAESIMDEMFIYDSLRDSYISETPTEDPHKDDYIATCVFADYDCPEMCTLRRYRDQFLATSWYGRLTVKAYRFMSPLLVKCLGKATGINRFFADKLTAKVKHLNESGVSNDDYEDKNLI